MSEKVGDIVSREPPRASGFHPCHRDSPESGWRAPLRAALDAENSIWPDENTVKRKDDWRDSRGEDSSIFLFK